MKKFFSLVAIATMVSFAACSNSSTETEAGADTTAVVTETAPEAEVTAPVDTNAVVAPADSAAAHTTEAAH